VLTEVSRQMDKRHRAGMRALEFAADRFAVVRRTVVDQNDLDRAARKHAMDLVDDLRDRRGAVVNGNNERQESH